VSYPEDVLQIPSAVMIASSLDFTQVEVYHDCSYKVSEILGALILFQGPKDTALYIQPKSSGSDLNLLFSLAALGVDNNPCPMDFNKSPA